VENKQYGFNLDSLIVPSIIIKSLMVNAQGTIFAGNANGKIYRSYNNGNSGKSELHYIIQ